MQLSPLRYPGGKSKACKILDKYLPDDFQTVVSPFFGGGSFENHLALKGKDVTGFDYCEPLACFWNLFLKDRESLFERVRELSSQILAEEYHGEISKEKREEQRQMFKKWRSKATTSESDLERAAHYFALNRGAFSGMTLIAGPMSTKWMEQKIGEKALSRLEKIEFKVNSVSHKSCFDVIPDVGCDLMYLDPPYIMEKKEKEGIYGEDGDMHRGFDHVLLRDQLKETKVKWVLSYLNVPEIHELYEGFNIYEEEWAYVMRPSKGEGSNARGKELVITNFE